jgi:hypothetical protein
MHNDAFYYKVPVRISAPSLPRIGKIANYVTISMTAKKLGNLLNPCSNGDLGGIVRRAKEMGDLTGVLAGALPPDHAAAIVAANVRENGELVVIAASSAWASRLRYESDALLEAARSGGISADTCRIRVSQTGS